MTSKIHNHILSVQVGLTVFLVSALVWAQEAVAPVADALPAQPSADEVIGLLGAFLNASKGGQWGLAAATGIMVAIWVLRKFFWKSIPGKLIPWVSSGAGVILAVAASLVGGADITSALSAGLVTGTAASGLWSLVGKHLFPGAKPAKPTEGG